MSILRTDPPAVVRSQTAHSDELIGRNTARAVVGNYVPLSADGNRHSGLRSVISEAAGLVIEIRGTVEAKKYARGTG
jgi:hypothetical protein